MEAVDQRTVNGFIIYTQIDSRGPTSLDNLPKDFTDNPANFEIKLIDYFIERPPPCVKLYHIFCDSLVQQPFFGGYKSILCSLFFPETLANKTTFPYIPFKPTEIRTLSFTVDPPTPTFQASCIFHVRKRKQHGVGSVREISIQDGAGQTTDDKKPKN